MGRKEKQVNRIKHGIEFAVVHQLFNHPRLEWIDKRKQYGEKRIISLSQFSPKATLTTIYTLRSNKIRIISIRKANNKERQLYYEYLQKTHQGN